MGWEAEDIWTGWGLGTAIWMEGEGLWKVQEEKDAGKSGRRIYRERGSEDEAQAGRDEGVILRH